ncbi:hypothetical protein SDC9_185710 [bioreactor metagenome]|uniref:Uncharacterized protein n=1 Tax=bioreactor metagenome TaxID=1076179 RepID=A0A645HHX2_9ZZZZ
MACGSGVSFRKPAEAFPARRSVPPPVPRPVSGRRASPGRRVSPALFGTGRGTGPPDWRMPAAAGGFRGKSWRRCCLCRSRNLLRKGGRRAVSAPSGSLLRPPGIFPAFPARRRSGPTVPGNRGSGSAVRGRSGRRPPAVPLPCRPG